MNMSITSPYASKNRSLAFRFKQAASQITVDYQEKFKPLSDVAMRSIYTVRYGSDKVEVYETVGPNVLTSLRSGSLGLACTALLQMSLQYGEPTLIYIDKKPGYSDITAEWWPKELLPALPERVAMHVATYSVEPIQLRDVEREAEKYLLR